MKVEYKVTGTSDKGPRTTVKTRNFEMVLDEPSNLGGTDSGPNPLEYLLAALCGCLTVTGRMVAREMGFTLESIEWNLSGEMDPQKFMGKSDEKRAGYEDIDIQCKLSTDADEQTLEKWVQAIEERCPVSDNLKHATGLRISAEKK